MLPVSLVRLRLPALCTPTHPPRALPSARRLLPLMGIIFLLLAGAATRLHAQNDTTGDPTGVSGDAGGLITTAGSYDAFNGNVKRAVTDLTVPGSCGAIPLALTRTYNSRSNAVPTPFTAAFADGNWRHSYEWSGQITTNAGGNTVYQIGYPDGTVINFRLGRTWAPSGETFARGPVGTSDRLEIANRAVNRPDGSSVTYGYHLHLADGSQVHLNAATGYLIAGCLEDLNGAVTALTYGTYQTSTVGSISPSYSIPVLLQVTEPGRWHHARRELRVRLCQPLDPGL